MKEAKSAAEEKSGELEGRIKSAQIEKEAAANRITELTDELQKERDAKQTLLGQMQGEQSQLVATQNKEIDELKAQLHKEKEEKAALADQLKYELYSYSKGYSGVHDGVTFYKKKKKNPYWNLSEFCDDFS